MSPPPPVSPRKAQTIEAMSPPPGSSPRLKASGLQSKGKEASHDSPDKQEDSGVAFTHPHWPSPKVTEVGDDAPSDGYKSPELLAVESAPTIDEAYNIVQVREAPESIESNSSVYSPVPTPMPFFLPHHRQSSGASELTSSMSLPSNQWPGLPEVQPEAEESELDYLADSMQLGVEQKSSQERLSDQDLNEVDETSSSEGSLVIEEAAIAAADQMQYKRGKKRAQQDGQLPTMARMSALFNEVIDEEGLTAPLSPIQLHPRTIHNRRATSSTWLHPDFELVESSIMPRPLRHHIELLFQAIREAPRNYRVYEQLFQHVFGPIVCNGRGAQMLESVSAVHAMPGPKVIPFGDGRQRLPLKSALGHLLENDHFIYRYLSSFDTFVAFREHYGELSRYCSTATMDDMLERMAQYYGSVSSSGYEYWAVARACRLANVPHRPLSPDDLTLADRASWLADLALCSTHRDAVTVTEAIFGPLDKVEDFPKPQVDLSRYWNACECGVCLRTRKRARIEAAEAEEPDETEVEKRTGT